MRDAGRPSRRAGGDAGGPAVPVGAPDGAPGGAPGGGRAGGLAGGFAGRFAGGFAGHLAACAAGALIGLGQIPFSLPWLALAVLVLVFAAGLPARPRTAFARGWWLGFGHFLVSLHWITQPFMVDPARDGWMAPFGLLFMAGGLALFWAAAFWAAALFRQGLRIAWLPAAALLVLFWTGADLLRAHVLTGFPWAMIGHVWIETGLAQTARLWGAHGLTLLTLTSAAVIGTGLVRWRGAAGWAPIITVPVALLVADLWLAPGAAPPPDDEAPLVRLVQPNVPQAEKGDPVAIPVYTRRLLDLTAGPGNPDLVVWPETALPWMIADMPDVLRLAAEAAGGAPLVLGAQRHDGVFYYNSLALLMPDATVAAVYDKHHLVPFGEYVPLGDLAGRLGIRGLAAAEGGGYAPGAGPAVMEIPGIGTALPLICYEGIFPEEIATPTVRARFMLLVTNDAWFGNFAGPYQHFGLGRLRAIEQGLPMVRVANTGVSAMIDAQGRVLDSLPLNVAGAIDARLPPALAATPYARFGDWPVAGCVLGLILCGLLAGLGQRRLAPRPKGIDPAGPSQ